MATLEIAPSLRGTTLDLICERKICDLIPSERSRKRWEASGILAMDGHYFVVFDDRPEIAVLSADLASADANNLVGKVRNAGGYEGIAYNSNNQRFYLLVEARKHTSGCYQAVIVEYDDEFNYIKSRRADFTFASDNKGFEAVAHRRYDGQDYLFALCEGNKCKCGAKGRKPGGGRIQVFEKRKRRWAHLHAIALPRALPFNDYSGMSIDNDRVAVVSQENSMLWVGQFDQSNWKWHDDGQLYEFPRSDDGEILYGNIEGVAWLTPECIATVSDRRKKSSQPDRRLSEKDQSVHIFRLP